MNISWVKNLASSLKALVFYSDQTQAYLENYTLLGWINIALAK